MDFYPYKSGGGAIEPVAVQNQNVALHYLNIVEWRRVTFCEPIPPFQFLDIGAVLASTISNRTQAANLQMPDDEFLQIRWWPVDPVQVRAFLPSGVARYSLLNAQSVVENNIVDRDPDLHLTELFIWENNNPAFEAVNFSDYNLAQVRLNCMGYRYTTASYPDATAKQINQLIATKGLGSETTIIGPCTHIWCSGRAS